ncbi:hypothetical protein [Thermodesulfobacterium hveragerdense]|uniref:hypothetical protein n=1 Tax=Thermodesulfobacterium hveragerdense TaxID=53424 RepID=UPI002480C210|nr:hypothetical protein [Thermodesulfobacterium hveragerdense]
MAEVKDVLRFSSAKKLIKYAGTDQVNKNSLASLGQTSTYPSKEAPGSGISFSRWQ